MTMQNLKRLGAMLVGAAACVVMSYSIALGWQDFRILRAIQSLEDVRPPVLRNLVAFQSNLYVLSSTGDRLSHSTAGTLLIVVSTDECEPCQNALSIWVSGLQREPVSNLDIWVAAPGGVQPKASLLAKGLGRQTRLLGIPAIDRYAALTGVQSAPMSIATDSRGDVTCIISGVPSKSGVSKCLAALRGGRKNSELLTESGGVVVPLASDLLSGACSIGR